MEENTIVGYYFKPKRKNSPSACCLGCYGLAEGASANYLWYEALAFGLAEYGFAGYIMLSVSV